MAMLSEHEIVVKQKMKYELGDICDPSMSIDKLESLSEEIGKDVRLILEDIYDNFKSDAVKVTVKIEY